MNPERSSVKTLSCFPQVLQEAVFDVYYEAGLALEMLRHSPELRIVDVTVVPEYPETGQHEEDVFVEASRRWTHLAQFKFTYAMLLGDRILSTIAKYCRRLESIECSLGSCTVDSVMALFSQACIKTIDLSTYALEIPQLDEEEKQVKMPSVVTSFVTTLSLSGRWYQRLFDKIHCPRLQDLSLRINGSRPLYCKPLLHSAAKSLAILHLCCDSWTGMMTRHHLDWSRFTRLERVRMGEISLDEDVALVRNAPAVRVLIVNLPPKSMHDVARLLNASYSTLLELEVTTDLFGPLFGEAGCLDFLLPSLLHPERRPQALERLTIPSYCLSEGVRSQFTLIGNSESQFAVSIDVKAYQPN